MSTHRIVLSAVTVACLSVVAVGQVGSVMPLLKIGSQTGGMGSIPIDSFFGGSLAALGDVNGDGIGDLAVGGWGTIWVLFLGTDGSVLSHSAIVGCGGRRLAPVGDLDGDGITELASTAYGCGGLSILFLRSDGTLNRLTYNSYRDPAFVPPTQQSYFEHSSRTGIRVGGLAALGDLDGDGLGDLAVGSPGDPDGGGSETGAVWILALRSDGSVRAAQKISRTHGGFTGGIGARNAFGSSVALLGDLDLDGHPELGVGAYGGPDLARFWTVSLKPDGSVQGQRSFGVGDYNLTNYGAQPDQLPDDVYAALGDLDGDGVTEVAMGFALHGFPGGESGGFATGFLRRDGTVRRRLLATAFRGGFATYGGGRFGESFAPLGDLDGDGSPEVAVGAPYSNGRGAVWILSLDLDAQRNGLGVNSQTLTQASEPIFGGIWRPTLDCSAHASGVATVWGYSRATSDILTAYGQILVGGTQFFQLWSTHASNPVAYSMTVPPDVALIDLPIHVQGACTGAPGPRLSNALDVVIGEP